MRTPAEPALGRSISVPTLMALTNTITHAKKPTD
jgi:hypothetical protein